MRGMSRSICVSLATLAIGTCLTGCPAHSGGRPHALVPATTDADRALRISIARAEAERGEVGTRALLAVLERGEPAGKLLALRGLGRIGGAAALAALRAALADPDPGFAAAAMGAIGVARELDDRTVEEGAALVPELHAVLARTQGTARVIALEALGRAGDQRSQPLLVGALAGAPDEAEAAGIALARHGRRKLALAPELYPQIIAATSSAEPRVRYAAVYALARAFLAGPPGAVAPVAASSGSGALALALARRVADEVPEIRAQAILALGKHGLVGPAHGALAQALQDRDWRVAVEAVRALAGDKSDDAGRDAVAGALGQHVQALERGAAAEAHVVLEGLRALRPYGKRAAVVAAANAIAARASAPTGPSWPPLVRGWIACLAAEVAVQAAGTGLAGFARCGEGALPDHLRLPLVAELVTSDVGSLQERRAALAQLLGHADVRVRAAGLGALVAPWKEGDAADHQAAVSVLIGALASREPIVAGAAIDAAGALYEAIGTGDHAALDAAVVARATREFDVELASALLELIGKQKLAAGAEACRAGLAGVPARAKAARGCLTALGEVAPAVVSAPAAVPPVDVADVIGAHLEWHLATTRGEIVIALRPEVSPWAVATIVALTRKGFYDGLAVHRVVPDFVVQGGDPTESGWGGPGYTSPAEPATTADGPGFAAGGVGMADAGRDSGGSQWFVMHSRAAHLDGRYTWVGDLISGANSADALQIGDVVQHATISIKSAVSH